MVVSPIDLQSIFFFRGSGIGFGLFGIDCQDFDVFELGTVNLQDGVGTEVLLLRTFCSVFLVKLRGRSQSVCIDANREISSCVNCKSIRPTRSLPD